jgi:hypothetical protein
MNDVYIIESWFGERLNVRQVYAADPDDALQTHELHYRRRRLAGVGHFCPAVSTGRAVSKILARLPITHM